MGLIKVLTKTAIKKGLSSLSLLNCTRRKNNHLPKYLSAPARTLEWLKNQELPTGGIRTHTKHSHSYPEVTGYLIPTLIRYGEKELAARLTRWLMCIQREDGSYSDPDGKRAYVFDAGQVCRGLLAGSELVEGALDAAARAADFIYRQLANDGKEGFCKQYCGDVPECVQLHVLPALLEAAKVFDDERYRRAAEQCASFYCSQKDFLSLDMLTHFLAYNIEALIDIGQTDLVLTTLDQLREEQSSDGSVRGRRGVWWVCTPGLAQLAICWYKAGSWQAADKAISWLENNQNPSGGFFGSYGAGASYFPTVEIPWAAKFYLDANMLRVKSSFDRNVSIFPASISEADGRVKTILEKVQPTNRVLEVGCGKGRFLKAIKNTYPQAECIGVDISSTLLSYVPEGIQRFEGTMEALTFPADSFDVVFSVEAIEHSPNLSSVIGEMTRVVRPGGWVIVTDKHRGQRGRLKCAARERWPKESEIRDLLTKGCDSISVNYVACDNKPASDGLMMVWSGRKRSLLTGSEWNMLLVSQADEDALVERVRYNHLSEWTQAIILETAAGEKVLEIGSGTGEISLALAQTGRNVTALDFNRDNLSFIEHCAAKLNVKLSTVCADATGPLPFSSGEFDCVWSSGLLEHFCWQERKNMLSEWAKCSRGKIISLVPNAACLAYRIGKKLQEQKGQWPYGLEMPSTSLRQEYRAAGLKVIREFSVGSFHALDFLPPNSSLRWFLSDWMNHLTDEELHSINQGYLLVTIGTKD